ncbi:FKBP-type peptidyl-prolyl cis-trans isomerase [Alteromonadaceae bacterium M269]|nr:FKBP-type peptidyl-prolyl cis-trans isomerase [Alteromonadaceae bacterium M269]
MKKTPIAIMMLATLGLAACQPSETKEPEQKVAVVLETDQQKQSYALGANVGQFLLQNLEQQKEFGVELDADMVLKGVEASLANESLMAPEQIQTQLQALETLVRTKQQEKIDAESNANLEAGQTYLAENAKRDGVSVTESGLQYEVLTEGDGPKPTAEDTVKVHYAGTLLDGTEFDSSYARNEPAVFPLRRVIAGWTEGLQLMNVGSKFKFFIPSELAYGGRATGQITPNSTLVFEVELLGIETPEAAPATE